MEDFPSNTTIILYRNLAGQFIHIEGGHRICAYAYAKKIGKPIIESKITAFIAEVSNAEITTLKEFLKTRNEQTIIPRS